MNMARYMVATDNAASGVAAEAAHLSPWFHNLHLPDGSQTAPFHPLGDFPACKWRQMAPFLPADLSGWSALDVGCNAGFYSFELARRGARVTAVEPDPHFLNQARWAARRLGLAEAIEFLQLGVYELAREPRCFDLVLFLGVFYHLRHPLLGLEILAEKTRRLMLFQTLTLPGDAVVQAPPDQDLLDREVMTRDGWPVMAFIEHALAGDPTNWWAPNHAAVEALLRSCNLSVSARPGHEIYLCQPAELLPAATRHRNQLELNAATGRRARD